MIKMFRAFFLFVEDVGWSLSCKYSFMLYGPYGLSGVIEKIPSHFLVKYLRRYGATIGNNCLIEKGLNLHRPEEKSPFRNLVVGNNVFIGHEAKIDLSRKVRIHDHVLIGSRCMLWTHSSDYVYENSVPSYKEYFGEIEICDHALIYSGVIISYGIRVGRNVKVGAGSMVNSYRSKHDRGF